jgi:hypothetical protein
MVVTNGDMLAGDDLQVNLPKIPERPVANLRPETVLRIIIAALVLSLILR